MKRSINREQHKIIVGASLAQDIQKLIYDLGPDHPDLDQSLVDLVDVYVINHPELDAILLGEEDEEEIFPDLVSAPIVLWG